MKKILRFFLVVLACMSSVRQASAQETRSYYCPPCKADCDLTVFNAPGKCPHCGMVLVAQTVAERAASLSAKRLKVLFYLQDGVEVLDFAGPMEVFTYAGFDVATVSKTKDPITSQGVLKIIPDYSINDAPQNADILAFFGGNAGKAVNDPEVIRWIKTLKKPDYYFSVCTGAFILGKAEMLDNLTVTTFHDSIESLKKALPKTKVLSNVRFVDNGSIITTAGISAGIDGALHLVAKIQGEKAAADVAFYMEYDKWSPGQGLVINPGGEIAAKK